MQVPGRYGKQGRFERPDEPALKVTFSSRTNLVQAGWGTDVRAHAEFCNREDRLPSFVGSPSPSLAWSDLFAGDHNVSRLVEYSTERSPPTSIEQGMPRSGDGAFIYHAFIIPFIKTEEYIHWRPEQTWDLQTAPHDVCFGIGTGNYFNNFSASNRLRLTVPMVRAAFDGARARTLEH